MRDRQASVFPNLDMPSGRGHENFRHTSNEGSRGRVDPVAREKMEQVRWPALAPTTTPASLSLTDTTFARPAPRSFSTLAAT